MGWMLGKDQGQQKRGLTENIWISENRSNIKGQQTAHQKATSRDSTPKGNKEGKKFKEGCCGKSSGDPGKRSRG